MKIKSNFKNICLTAFYIGLAFSIPNSSAQVIENAYCNVNYLPINAQNKLMLVRDHFLFLEGPTWSEENSAFYFSEMNFNSSQAFGPQSTIYQLNLPNRISVYKENSGTNGLLAAGEFLYTMNHASRSLSRINFSSGKDESLVNDYKGLKFNSPNDLVQASDGTIYFTDPNWQLSGRPQETPYTGVYAMTSDGILTLIDDSLEKPNGIALSPDQRTLYVGSFTNEINKYQVDFHGNVGKKKAFININSPDGMAIDCAGNIYATSHNEGVIYIYSPAGKQLDKIIIGPKITNIAFGGKTLKTLLITTDHGLYTMEVNIAGLRVAINAAP
jgi:gluconolactonase